MVETAAAGIGWGRPLPAGRGLGIAGHYSFVSYVAVAAEVEVSSRGALTIPRVDIAIDCGPQVNPERIRSEAAFAKLAGTAPIPASSGLTTRHRLARGGHRQLNAALYRVAIVRMRFHQPTIDYVARRTADGRTKRDIIRCLQRYLAREIYARIQADRASPAGSS